MENTNDKTAPIRKPFPYVQRGPSETIVYWQAAEAERYVEAVASARAEEARREGAEQAAKIAEAHTRTMVNRAIRDTERKYAAQRTAGGDAVAFTEAWKRHYQYSPSFRFLDDSGAFCTPDDDPVHFGWVGWQLAQRQSQPVAEAAAQADDDVLKALKKAAGLLRAAGFCMTGTATAQIVAAINAASICTTPPPGWQCTRPAGHDGPCAAIPAAAPTARPTLPSAGKESPCAN